MAVMDKIWFININAKQEGPYSLYELKRDVRITPDIFVWKEGFDQWKRIRDVPELKSLFEDENASNENEPIQFEPKKKLPGDEVLVEGGGLEPPYFFWLIIAFLAILYAIYQLYGNE